MRLWHGIQRRDWVVVAIIPSLLLAGMTSTFTDLVRPFVVTELASDRYRYQWVTGSTFFGSVTGMSLIAWMRGRFGLKWCYVTGLVVFTLGSLACAMAPNMELLGVARFVQGWGNGMVVTTVLAVFYTDKLWICAVTAGWAAAVGLVASPLICISQEDMTPAQIASSASIKNFILVMPAFLGTNLMEIFIERRDEAHFDAIRQTILPNRPPWGDVWLRLVDYYTLQGLGPGDAERQAGSLIGRFTHDYATVFAFHSAFQVLALVLFVGFLLSLTLKPLPPQAPGPPVEAERLSGKDSREVKPNKTE